MPDPEASHDERAAESANELFVSGVVKLSSWKDAFLVLSDWGLSICRSCSSSSSDASSVAVLEALLDSLRYDNRSRPPRDLDVGVNLSCDASSLP